MTESKPLLPTYGFLPGLTKALALQSLRHRQTLPAASSRAEAWASEYRRFSPGPLSVLTCPIDRLTRLTYLRDDFAVLGGFVDFLGPSLLAGAAGGITGTANVAPVCLFFLRS